MAKKQMTICSTMFCYNDAEVTGDPSHPPFCDECKDDNKDKDDDETPIHSEAQNAEH